MIVFKNHLDKIVYIMESVPEVVAIHETLEVVAYGPLNKYIIPCYTPERMNALMYAIKNALASEYCNTVKIPEPALKMVDSQETG